MLTISTSKNGEISFKCSVCKSICSSIRPNGAFYIPVNFKQRDECNCITSASEYSFGSFIEQNHRIDNFAH